MSHCGGQTIKVVNTNHYPHLTHFPLMPHITRHFKISLSKPHYKTNTNWGMETKQSSALPPLKGWGESKCKRIQKTMTARKKKLLQREGLGHLPIHAVCAFAIARLNQYVSNSAWNTISPCLKRRRKIRRGKIKDEPHVPLKSFHIQHIHSFSYAWQLVMCCSSRRKQTERKLCICMNLQTLS